MQACVRVRKATTSSHNEWKPGNSMQNKNTTPYYLPIACSEAPNGLLWMDMAVKSVDSRDKLQSCEIPSQRRENPLECALRHDRSEVPCMEDCVTTTLLWLLQDAQVEQWRNRKYMSSAPTQERHEQWPSCREPSRNLDQH
jgi:hypothetical protein